NEIKTILEGWDAEMDARSSTASFFAIWYSRHLIPALIETLFGNVTPVKSLSSSSVLELMQNRAYDELVITSLENAYKECVRLMGRYPERWHWGDLHAIRFEHPLYPFAEGLLKDSMELMSYPRGGSGNTTNSNGFFSRNLRVRSGASWRFVVDTGDWGSARMTNTPGQSGNPESPYYDNLLEDWANDRTFPLLFSRKRIEENAAFTINLVPSNKSTTE
ncbi:MAG: penicillin acylase family protein, partial [Pseudomonadota bacterium]|nr:penicillin acylase family protein [Pseudomonadota bacterium]